MYFRVLWETLARQQRAWSRCRPPRRPPGHFRSPLERCTRRALLLSFTGVYNATKENKTSSGNRSTTCNIDDAFLHELAKEMDCELERLKQTTLLCKECKKRLLIDKPLEGKMYCNCENNAVVEDEASGWYPFLETKDIIIWRREEKPGTGLYEYKVYGRYEEITAEDFLAMHTDLVYWRSWDATALSVKTLPPVVGPQPNQDVIYWETLWPRFFSNRDYVYVRRYAYLDSEIPANTKKAFSRNPTKRLVNVSKQQTDSSTHPQDVKNESLDDFGHKLEQNIRSRLESGRNMDEIGRFMNKTGFSKEKRGDSKNGRYIVMTSQSCMHPDAPETKNAYRVKRYWSNLVIKPFTELDKPGIEFSLTYFDDPGTNIPSTLQSWVAGHACPDFLNKMRLAAANYRKTTEKTPAAEVQKKLGTVQDLPSTDTTVKPTSFPRVQSEGVILASVDSEQVNEKSDSIKEIISTTETASEKPTIIDKVTLAKEKAKKETEDFLNLLIGKLTDAKDKSGLQSNMGKTGEGKMDGTEVKERLESGEKENVNLNTTNVKNIDSCVVKEASEKERNENLKGEKCRDNEGGNSDEGGKLKKGSELKTEKGSTQEEAPQQKEPTQQGNMSYWHMWPLYYFA